MGFLYGTAPGRILLRLFTTRGVSRLCGRFLDSGASKHLIKGFVRRNGIDTEDYYCDGLDSFNAFFSRRIKEDRRPVEMEPSALISPCDGLLSVYDIKDSTVIPVKQSSYTISSLLGGDAIWEKFRNGTCLVFRLCVDNYHRYCYLDDGVKGENIFLPGKLHTVRPVALGTLPVFTENCREYTVIKTENFGEIVQMEVGAMLVGKIKNYQGSGYVKRGEEKGMFLYGGSTIVVLLKKGCARLTDEVYAAAQRNEEFPVKMGQAIGRKVPLASGAPL